MEKTMKPLTRKERLWLGRGKALGRGLNILLAALANMGYRGFRQRLRDRTDTYTQWHTPAH
jgi:hypothetical protein